MKTERGRSHSDAGATNSSPTRRWGWLLGLVILLIPPGLALARYAAHSDTLWLWLLGGASAMSLFAFIAFAADKGRAVAHEWRISEFALHLLEILGGWPGAFVAQHGLRHKNAKSSYQAVFWLIVALHQLVAIDYLLGWPMARSLSSA